MAAVRCCARPSARTLKALCTGSSCSVGARCLSLSHRRRKNEHLEVSANLDDLFSYTSGRYIFNERLRLRERHAPFNVEALQTEVEKSVNHGKIRSIKKLAEGGFNRVLLLTMEDDFEVIAKIPYRIARPKHFATASEVATLAFLNLKGVSVPKVYGYSSTEKNAVGTEYILMQKASGICMSKKRPALEDIDIKRLAHSFVEIEKGLFDIPFGAIGSLYFKKDVPPELQAPLYRDKTCDDDGFCIGPTADYMFWYGRRSDLDLQRGPWRDHVEYLRSIAEKEIQWTQQFGMPLEPDFPHNTLGMGVQAPETYVRLLRHYQSLAPYLLAKDMDAPLNQPTLRHPDPTPGNLFVSTDTGRISCLIDWQHAVIQPRLLAAGYPRAFENPDTGDVSSKLIEPKLPQNIASLSTEERTSAYELYRQRLLFYSYRVLNGHLNKKHIEALRDPLLLGRQLLVDRAGRQWEGNFITLKGAILRAAQFWEHFPDTVDVKCPIQFERSEIDRFNEEEEDWLRMTILEEGWRQRLNNVSEDGWVSHTAYDSTKKKLQQLEMEVRKQCEDDEEDLCWFQQGWPFKDRDEIN